VADSDTVPEGSIGFAGVGLMGHGMARNILDAGYRLSVIANRNREPIDDLVSRGASETTSPRKLAEAASIVVLCLPNSDVVKEVLSGTDGLLSVGREDLLIIDSSTGDPTRTVGFAELCADAGATYIDAPVNRTPIEALAGTLHVLVGSDDESLHRARPILETFSETIHHLGPVGAGHATKVIHNFISQGNAAILAEAFTTAAKSGVDLAALAEVCRHSGGHSRTFDRLIPFVLSGDDSGFKFAIHNVVKDMNYYLAISRSVNTTSIVGDSVKQLFQLADQIGYGNSYGAHIFDALGQLNDTSVHHVES
jgi:3-hydroxyisobutyrate dehydrogenase-like beta-hydroxyacid dehydrogenase